MEYLLLVTWFLGGNATSSYQVSFATRQACDVALSDLRNDAPPRRVPGYDEDSSRAPRRRWRREKSGRHPHARSVGHLREPALSDGDAASPALELLAPGRTSGVAAGKVNTIWAGPCCPVLTVKCPPSILAFRAASNSVGHFRSWCSSTTTPSSFSIVAPRESKDMATSPARLSRRTVQRGEVAFSKLAKMSSKASSRTPDGAVATQASSQPGSIDACSKGADSSSSRTRRSSARLTRWRPARKSSARLSPLCHARSTALFNRPVEISSASMARQALTLSCGIVRLRASL